MSRFADPTATAPVDLGACQCPGTPHEKDEGLLRWQLGGSALARIGTAETIGRLTGDPFAGYRAVAAECLVSWNLLIEQVEDGVTSVVPVPINSRSIEALDDVTLTKIAETADELIQGKGTLPNASGAPSVESPLGSASPIPISIPKRGTSNSPSAQAGRLT
jgi:hypothetical protein